MDSRLFSDPDLLAGVAGGLMGLAGGAIGFFVSWKAAKSRKQKQGMIWLSLACLLLIGGHCFVQLSVENETVKAVGLHLYIILLISLILFYNRWEQRFRTSADHDRPSYHVLVGSRNPKTAALHRRQK